MKVAHGDEIPLLRGLEYRGGTFHFRNLMAGVPGRLDNFQLSYDRIGGDFCSPRHRHNFEQIRYQLAGELDYARDGKLKSGMVGYFPEGVAYGPQSQSPDDECITVVLQCGAASRSGYLSRAEIMAGMEALAAHGEFKDGVFRRFHIGDKTAGKRNVDGYQAIWEHVNGRPMRYPEPRHDKPLFMDPADYEWRNIGAASDVREKHLGVFSEARTEAALIQLDTGATWTAPAHSVNFVVTGKGAIGDAPYRPLTTVWAQPGDAPPFTATAPTELIRFGLPDLGLAIGPAIEEG